MPFDERKFIKTMPIFDYYVQHYFSVQQALKIKGNNSIPLLRNILHDNCASLLDEVNMTYLIVYYLISVISKG